MLELTTSEFFATLLIAVSLYIPQTIDVSLKPRNIPAEELLEEYDFIIVGAGSAGCVLANRLTENDSWKVLLIEAGGDDNITSLAPYLFTHAVNTELDWNYTTVRQSRTCLVTNGECLYNRGHVLGGSSSVNAMVYVRGNKADYDEWARLGNEGWSYQDVLPYFIKAENVTEPALAGSAYHGTEGPLNVQYFRYSTPMKEIFVQAGEEFGWQRGDYNGERQDVVGYMQTTTDGPYRESTVRAYLDPIKYRENLHIIKHSVVSNVIIKDQVAKGVNYYRDGQKFSAYATKEVILSAGAINTPKVLMLSGVGPEDELRRYSIDVVKNLPVGKRLVDHTILEMQFEIDPNITIRTDVWKTNESIQDFAARSSGPLTTTGGEALVFFNIFDKSEPPNLQLHLFSTTPFQIENQQRNVIAIIMSNVQPKSVGSVKLQSGNWKEDPLIDPNYFSEKIDYDVYIKGIDMVFQFMQTPSMQALSPRFFTEYQPLCKDKAGEDRKQCLISQYSSTIYHPVSTAKMGPAGDKEAVVNPKLQVYGIDKLRVVDASIMPTIPRGNTNAPTIMVAEKAADIIKTSYS